MKKYYYILFLIIALSACTSQNYYQLIETESNASESNSSSIIFENEELEISFDFWGDKGNGSFIVFNKTDKDIFIDLKRSHLIINDLAITYFQNRNFSNKKVSFFSPASDDFIKEQQSIKLPGVSPKPASVQANETVVFYEERVLCIPPHSKQMIFGFNLMENIYRDCNLYRFPNNKQILSSEFTSENSPYIYRNRISYSYDEKFTTIKTFETNFFVKKITNYPENEFIKYESVKFCSDSSSYSTEVYPMYKPNSFYIKYKLEPGRIDH
jgi:hypothetical protein